MAFSLLPAERGDLRELAEIFHEAFATDPEFCTIYQKCDVEETIKSDLVGYEKEFDTPGRRFFKVVDSENGILRRIVAMSKWWFPYTLTPEQEAAGVGSDKLPETYPEGTVRDLADSFFADLFEKRKKYINHETQYFVNILAVRPDYQRKGLGAMLLEDGLALADRDGCNTYIEASAKGLGLYLKYGWKEIDDIKVDTRPYGGHSVESTKCMMRDPQPPKPVKA